MEELKPKITILEIRAKHKMSQEEFGKELGVSAQTVSAWEKNVMSISAKNLIKIFLHFGVKSSDLLGA